MYIEIEIVGMWVHTNSNNILIFFPTRRENNLDG